MNNELVFCQTKDQRDARGAQRLGTRASVRACWSAGCLFLFAAWVQTFGQVSVLDSSFKVGPGANGAVDALMVQADQRILVGGAFGRLLGQPRPSLARLLEDGSVDGTFDASAVLNTNAQVFSMALQDDGRVLVGYYEWDYYASRIVRLDTNGTPDPTFVCTNQIGGYVFALLPQADGGVLFGGNWCSIANSTNYCLFRLKPDGQVDDTFDAGLGESSLFCLVRQPNGQILAGGLLNRRGSPKSSPLLRLNADLQWDEDFRTDVSGGTGLFSGPSISSMLLEPGGKLIVGGCFFEVGGYWRRQILRLTPEGHVDGCFDPGLGLGGATPDGPVRVLARQPDGRILVGGVFQGVDTAYGQFNLARLLPQSDCDLIRVYINGGEGAFLAATFPPGRTNYLETSDDLTNWQCVETNTSPYIWYWNFSTAAPPRAFFRARQER